MWRRYLVLLAVSAAAAGLTMIWLGPFARGYVAGLYSAAWIAIICFSLMLDGSHFRMMGAEAERWTAQELRKAERWWVKDSVEFADRDIDHVAISPSQILAVETKWTHKPVSINEQGVTGLYCDAVDQAARGAKRIGNLLASRGVHHPVTPVLVRWCSGVLASQRSQEGCSASGTSVW
jgi:hypothetical protein